MKYLLVNVLNGVIQLDPDKTMEAAKSGQELLVEDETTNTSMIITPIELWEIIEREEYTYGWQEPIHDVTATKLIKLMNYRWYNLLKDEFSQDYMKQLSSFVRQERQQYKIYPNPHQVFRALRLTDPFKIRVIIVGQDPYPDGSADGLCFSATGRGLYVPPSLRIIKDNLEQTVGFNNSTLQLGNDLSEWAKQGVLLLNTSLTVRHGEPGSHRNRGWETFVKKVIETAKVNNEFMVSILWGKHAQQFMEDTPASNYHLVLMAHHPAYIARQGSQHWNHTHFVDANQFLITKLNTHINW